MMECLLVGSTKLCLSKRFCIVRVCVCVWVGVLSYNNNITAFVCLFVFVCGLTVVELCCVMWCAMWFLIGGCLNCDVSCAILYFPHSYRTPVIHFITQSSGTHTHWHTIDWYASIFVHHCLRMCIGMFAHFAYVCYVDDDVVVVLSLLFFVCVCSLTYSITYF